MKKLLVGLAALASSALLAPRADAKIAAVYGSGQGGFQSGGGAADAGGGFEVGARLFVFDVYADYIAIGNGQSVSRAIFGLRGGLSFTDSLRLVGRAGVGAVHEEDGALTRAVNGPSRTGGVARVGAALEGNIAPLLWLGVGADGEGFLFADNAFGYTTRGTDVLATGYLTFELGI